MTDRITFIVEHSDGERVEMSMSSELTWSIVTENFYRFLLAAGYSLPEAIELELGMVTYYGDRTTGEGK